MRRFWALLGASVFVWGAGQAVWSYYEVMLGRQVPSPSLADVGFLSAVPLMVGALLVFPVPPVRSLARRETGQRERQRERVEGGWIA